MAKMYSFGEFAGKRESEIQAAGMLAEQALNEFEGNVQSLRALMNSGGVWVTTKSAAGKQKFDGPVIDIAEDDKSFRVRLNSGTIQTVTGEDFGGMRMQTTPPEAPPPVPPLSPPPLRIV
jgi:hypothetical protein